MRFVVIPASTNTNLSNQRTGEEMVVVQAGAVGILDALSFKVALRRAAAKTEDWRLENGRTLIAEPGTQAIFVREIRVDFHIHKIGILLKRKTSDIVVGSRVG